jgi:hypothetical protein
MKPLTPVAHREAAERPAGHGRVVEVHRRRGAGLTYDLLIILGVHTHVMKLGASKAEATTAARHIAHR